MMGDVVPKGHLTFQATRRYGDQKHAISVSQRDSIPKAEWEGVGVVNDSSSPQPLPM